MAPQTSGSSKADQVPASIRLTLADAVRGAWACWSNRLAPMSTDDFKQSRLTFTLSGCGGMRPWLRLALGEGNARAMEEAGRGRWHLGALAGIPDFGTCWRPETAALAMDPAEAATMLLLEVLCEEGCPGHAYSVQQLVSMIRARDIAADKPWHAASPFAQRFLDRDCKDDIRGEVTGLLHEIAASCGVTLDPSPQMSGIWRERTVLARVMGRTKTHYAVGGGVLCPASVSVEDDDGRTWELWEERGDRRRSGPLVGSDVICAPDGAVLVLRLEGCTSGHPGQVRDVRRFDDVICQATAENWLWNFEERERRSAEFRASEEAGCVDASGRKLSVGDRVVLDCDCLEARKGTDGKVVEIVVDMAMVRFAGRRRPVPCFGHALVPEHQDSLAA